MSSEPFRDFTHSKGRHERAFATFGSAEPAAPARSRRSAPLGGGAEWNGGARRRYGDARRSPRIQAPAEPKLPLKGDPGRRGWFGALALLRVEEDGNGAVVHEVHVHRGPEAAGFDGERAFADGVAEGLE